MSYSVCCVVNCKNTGRNCSLGFYKFPVTRYKLEQRKKWIAALQKINSVESLWFPKASDRICGRHFIENTKSENQFDPNYVPTIFSYESNTPINKSNIINRHNRFMKRRLRGQQVKSKAPTSQVTLHDTMESTIDVGGQPGNDFEAVETKTFVDQGCQVDLISENNEPSKKFVCNTFMYNNCYIDVAIQTEIIEATVVKISNTKKYKNKECNTETNISVDASVETELGSFFGIKSVNNDKDLINLAGVTFNNFDILLRRMPTNVPVNCKISVEDRLLMFLMKIKTGLTFSAISVIYCIHRTTVSGIFYSTLELLACATANFVFWPGQDIVQKTMPKCFYPDYSNTRVIIDCTKFHIKISASLDNRVYTYLHYKKGFTAKVLIGITPSGFISFKSKVAGGRKSDSQLTIESGLIDLLEEGDRVLADKGFPEIRQIMDETGKNITLVMPPFLEKNSEFTKEQTEETYNIAKVRIHVERIIQIHRRNSTYLLCINELATTYH